MGVSTTKAKKTKQQATLAPDVDWGKPSPPAFFKSPSKTRKPSKITREQMSEFLKREMKPDTDPDTIIRNTYKYFSGKKALTDYEVADLVHKASTLLALNSDLVVSQTFNKEYSGMAIELQRQLVKEFQCTTRSEKMLIDVFVSGYIRQIICTRSLQSQLLDSQSFYSLSPARNGYMAMVSKELDRATRQMLTAYQMLTNLKQPPVKIEVKAKNAFLAHNQQINTTAPLNQEKSDG